MPGILPYPACVSVIGKYTDNLLIEAKTGFEPATPGFLSQAI